MPGSSGKDANTQPRVPTMAIELRHCEPLHVPVLLRALGSWREGLSVGLDDDAAARSLLGLTRNPLLGSVWLIEHRQELVGYAVVERCSPRGFLWQEAALTGLYLVPGSRQAGIGRVVRRVLADLLLGHGCGLVPEDRTREDRHWSRLSATASAQPMLSSAA
jgi:hypothetical protein